MEIFSQMGPENLKTYYVRKENIRRIGIIDLA